MSLDFKNLRFSLIIIGLIMVCLFNAFPMSNSALVVIFGIIIALTGIPHGAMDFYLEKQNQINSSNHFSPLRFYVFYFSNMLVYIISWYFFPSFALVLFILFASFHFGEIDLNALQKHKASLLLSIFYGLSTNLFIVSGHLKETVPILSFLMNGQCTENQIIDFCSIFFMASIAGILICWLVLIVFNKSPKREVLIMNAQLSVVLTIVHFLPFYLAFAYYFGLWHSFLSFNIIKQHLSLENNPLGWKAMILKMLPFSLVAIIFICFVIGVIQNFELKQIIGAMFIGISIITLPHIQIFSKTIGQIHRASISR